MSLLRYPDNDNVVCSRCGHRASWSDVLLVVGQDKLCYDCARTEIAAGRAKIAALIKAGDALLKVLAEHAPGHATAAMDWLRAKSDG